MGFRKKARRKKGSELTRICWEEIRGRFREERVGSNWEEERRKFFEDRRIR